MLSPCFSVLLLRMAAINTIKGWTRTAESTVHRALATFGGTQSEARISTDAQDYWDSSDTERWRSNSHWRDARIFANGDLWHHLGAQHLEMFERGARAVNFTRSWGRVIEWGCGGGANAVHFAGRADEFVGVDVSGDSVRECGHQVAAVCDTRYVPMTIEVSRPERVIDELGAGTCDIFLSFYVFELIPTQHYGERLLRIAHQLLAHGGLALVQIKYDDGRWSTRSHRRAYRSGLAAMTTYTISDFWQLAERCGFESVSVELVPENELDERYAYFLFSKPDPDRS
jgi:SAM-dependent methyltransferase